MTTRISGTTLTFPDSTTMTTVPDRSLGQPLGISTYTAAGTYTWTPPAGCNRVLVRVVGGGGGGCGYCESGGAGGYAEGYHTTSAAQTVVVGAGGAGTGYYSASGVGGTSSFGGFISASGGTGANNHYSHSGGHGGAGSGGQVQTHGGTGSGHTNSVGYWAGGTGGKSYFGGGTAKIRSHGPTTNVGQLPGGAPGAGGPGQVTDGGDVGVTRFGSADYYNNRGITGCVVVYAFK